MCWNNKKGSIIGMAMMGMGMGIMAGMMMSACASRRMSDNRSTKKIGLKTKSNESDLQKA